MNIEPSAVTQRIAAREAAKDAQSKLDMDLAKALIAAAPESIRAFVDAGIAYEIVISGGAIRHIPGRSYGFMSDEEFFRALALLKEAWKGIVSIDVTSGDDPKVIFTAL